MVTESSTPLTGALDKMIMPSATKRERPSTANTMCLVLKPRQEDYRQLTQISGSEKEREAYRKNRVMQMKLGAYLAEVCLQQRSSARLLKTEEYRFMQEVTRRSSVPRSVMMLQKLQDYRDKKFPDAPFAYGNQSSQGTRTSLHHQHPLSARNPARSQRFQALLDRPKTSASLFRQSLNDQEFDDVYDVLDKHETLVASGTGNRYDINKEEIYPLGLREDKTQRPATSGQTSDLPFIKKKDVVEDNTISTLISSESFSKKFDSDLEIKRKASIPADRLTSLKQRHNSVNLNASLKRMNSVGKFSSSDLPLQRETIKDTEVESNDSFEHDPKVVSLLHEELKALDDSDEEENDSQNKNKFQKEDNDIVFPLLDNVEIQNEDDQSLDIIDLDIQEENRTQTRAVTPKTPKRSKPTPAKTNFSRVKAEPVMPLRHNITSVLRQERTKYENSQMKIKDYLHKMTSRDFMTRGNNPRDTSAQSRRSSLGRGKAAVH